MAKQKDVTESVVLTYKGATLKDGIRFIDQKGVEISIPNDKKTIESLYAALETAKGKQQSELFVGNIIVKILNNSEIKSE